MTKIGVTREQLEVSCEGEAQGFRFGATKTVIEILSDAERVGAAVQGPTGRSLVYDWDGARLGVGYEGEPLEYKDLGRAYGVGGWALWKDPMHTETNPLELVNEAPLQFTPEVDLTHAPEDAAAWFDGMTFRPTRAGESYALRLAFTAVPLVAERELSARLSVPGRFTVWGDQLELSRGAGVPQRVALQPLIYALDTFVQNGAIFVLAADGPLELYDITLMAVRLSE